MTTTTSVEHLFPFVDEADMPEYPIGRDDRIDSHHFLPWERRRWLNSSMRLKGTPEARALYFDLICVSYEQTPVGTLPDDLEELAKLSQVAEGQLRTLCSHEYGPLHNWRPCLSDGERRLYHPFVLRTLTDSLARKEDNRARCEAANTKKRLQRLRSSVAGYHVDLAKNDAAIIWMDEWLVRQGTGYRNATWTERAIRAWSDHRMELGMSRGPRGGV